MLTKTIKVPIYPINLVKLRVCFLLVTRALEF